MVYSLSHYLSKQRLKAKAEEYGCRVVVADEHYTPETRRDCSRINHNLEYANVFKCPYADCGFTLGRDLNGSHNVDLNQFGLFNLLFDEL